MSAIPWTATLKTLTTALLGYVFVQGLLGPVPDLVVLEETIRNLYFHVPLWFAMILMLLGSLGFSIAYLVSGADRWDERASSLAAISIVFGIWALPPACCGAITPGVASVPSCFPTRRPSGP